MLPKFNTTFQWSLEKEIKSILKKIATVPINTPYSNSVQTAYTKTQIVQPDL